MSDFEIIIRAFCLAFCFVEILDLGRHKPFNCLTCMTGWFALILGLIYTGWHGLWLLPVGITVGAIFSAIKMKWL